MKSAHSHFRWFLLGVGCALLVSAVRADLSRGAVAPDLVMLASDGSAVRLSDYRGKVVVLDVWATWCGPCLAAQPHLSALAERHAADGVVVVAVCANDSLENFTAWSQREAGRYKFRAVRDPAGRVGWESSVLQRDYGVKGFPTVYVIDREGRVVGSALGGGDSENLNIPALLAQAGIPVDKSKLPEPLLKGDIVQRALPVLTPSGAAVQPSLPPSAVAAPYIPLFLPQLGKMKIGDPVPDFALMVEGQLRQLSDFSGKPLVICLVFNAIPSSAYRPKMEAIVGRYHAAYGVQTVVVKVNTTAGDYQTWLAAQEGSVSFLRGWDPAGRFAPSRPELAQQEFPAWDARTLIRTLQGPGTSGTPQMPAYLVVGADSRFGGWLGGHQWFEDGLANLLAHAGVPLTPDHQPKLAAAPEDFLRQEHTAPQAALSVGGMAPDFEFTNATGNQVKLSSLRGRVVLLDFWATWCGPCIAELPNVRAAYEKFHDKGFEVVGVALENAGLRSKDTPEQSAEKLKKSKEALATFTAENRLPWPQHFDGKYWKNEIAVKYGIQSIPAMFLIDQDGKLVTTEARGEKLEQEVKRLLNL